jgi:hypothetical protein
MKPRCLILLSVGLLAMASSEVQAHFLFIHIGPPAEAGRAAEVYFSELADAGDPRFIDKVAHTQLWVRTDSSPFKQLTVQKAADRLRAYLPASGSVVVVGSCQYGVLARPKQVPFLLRYYPKALAGKPAELDRLQPCGKTPLEIVATVEGDHLKLVALAEGKPIPKAEFHTVDAQLANEELIADAKGQVSWKPAEPGRYSVYVRRILKESGEAGGAKYEEIREFATLAFTWPLEPKGADPQAVARFEEALAARAQWKGFSGFRAKISGQVDGRSFDGTVTIDANGNVELKTYEKVVERWVKEQLESLAMHRGAGESEPSADRPKPVLWFGEEREDHPLGRLLIFDSGRFASSYRVKDKQILVVNRLMGKQNLTITVLDNERNQEGRFLPRSYTVQYWDAATGALRRMETVQERWQRVGAWDLPNSHTVTLASDSGLAVRNFSLTEHQLLKPNGRTIGKTGK